MLFMLHCFKLCDQGIPLSPPPPPQPLELLGGGGGGGGCSVLSQAHPCEGLFDLVHARTRTHTHAHARTRTHTHAHARTRTHTHARTHAHTHTPVRTHRSQVGPREQRGNHAAVRVTATLQHIAPSGTSPAFIRHG
uniref:Uncharacterized protein n=1 Tax=Astatotilapia calliptera TaxID=8154 RepID=A0AAX7TU03_ASTCA